MGESKSNLPLEQVKLQIGDVMQLQIQSELGDARHYVTLVGYLKGESVIVTTPVEAGKVMLIREGQPFVVRFFSGKNAYAFSVIARRVTNVPYPHMHLSYPREVRAMVVRSSSRARVNLIGSVANAAGVRFACQVRDLSIGGALLAANQAMGEVGERLLLNLRVRVGGAEHLLDVDCRIRSCIQDTHSADQSLSVLHGVSFEDLSVQGSLVLSALLYNSMQGQSDDL
jgi:hypothetical protein